MLFYCDKGKKWDGELTLQNSGLVLGHVYDMVCLVKVPAHYKKASEYDQEMSQSHTTAQTMPNYKIPGT